MNYIGIYGVFFEECVILGQYVGKIKTPLQQHTSRVWNISCYHLDLSLNSSSIDINDNLEVRHAFSITVVDVQK